jgi:hypothetical protein
MGSIVSVKAYWQKLVEGGCLICRRPAEVAHAHGGSIVERMGEPKAKGKKLPRYDWLVLALCPEHHRLHNQALDLDVKAWERHHGAQANWIDYLAALHGLDLWKLAKETA